MSALSLLRMPDPRFYRDLLRIALPIALQNLVSSSVNMLDTVMVGRLGATELAAVGLGNQVYFLLLLLLFGLSTGAGVFTAQYWGKRDLAGLRRSFGLALTLGLGAAAIYFVAAFFAPRLLIGLYSRDPEVIGSGARYLRIASLSYLPMAASFVLGISLRGVERVRLPLAATTISLAANAFLNWVLIFGKLGAPRLGIEGAAWATVVSRWLEAVIIYVAAWARRMPPAGKPRELLGWDRAWAVRFMAIALPVVVNEVIWSLGYTTYNAIFARIGTGAVAAYNVTNAVNQLAMVLFFGTANAAAVMIGKKIGEGERGIAGEWAKRYALLAPLVGFLTGVLLIPARALLPLMFKVPPAVLAEASLMLLVLAFAFPVRVFNLHLVVGICRAGGDTTFGALFDLGGVWGIGVPLALLAAFVWGMPAWAVFLLTNVEEVAKSFVGLARLRSGKWLRDVTG